MNTLYISVHTKETIYHNRWNVFFPNNILNSKSRSRHHIRMLCLHSEMEQRGCCYGNGSVLESQIERQDFFFFFFEIVVSFLSSISFFPEKLPLVGKRKIILLHDRRNICFEIYQAGLHFLTFISPSFYTFSVYRRWTHQIQSNVYTTLYIPSQRSNKHSHLFFF